MLIWNKLEILWITTNSRAQYSKRLESVNIFIKMKNLLLLPFLFLFVAMTFAQGNAEIYYNRGQAKVILGDIQGAEEEYTKAISYDPNYYLAFYNRGVIRADYKNDFTGALEDYNQCLTINPNYADPYLNRGVMKAFQFKDYNGGVTDISKYINFSPNDYMGYYNRGTIKIQLLEDDRGGILDLNKALSINPNHAKSWLNRGVAKLYLNDKDGACADLQKSCELGESTGCSNYNSKCKQGVHMKID